MRKMRLFSIIGAAALLATSSAHATGSPLDTLFSGVDLSNVTTNVVTVGTAVIGIVLAFKGIELVKRATGKGKAMDALASLSPVIVVLLGALGALAFILGTRQF